MANIAEIYIPADEFALKDTLSQVPEARFDIERAVAHGNDRVLPFVWATADDSDTMDAALTADPSVENIETLYEHEEDRLYRMEWTTRVRVLIYILTEGNATVLNLSGFDYQWEFRVLFPNRDALSATYAFCRDRGLSFDLRGIYELSEAAQRGHFGLTDMQQEALIEAVKHGYFDIPRSATMDELAEILDISRQAVSERLRRGHRRLIESALILGQADIDPSLLPTQSQQNTR
jgi:predicted DNA binding protein